MYRIMVVEDDRFYRYEITNYLQWEDYGFTIWAEAINGRTALEQMEEEQPDVVFTDISMPEMNGIELIRRLREKYPRIKIIVLSSYNDFTFVKDAMKLGAMDYVLKHTMKQEEMVAMLQRIQEAIEKDKKEEKKNLFFEANFSAVSDKYLRRFLQEEYKPEDMAPFWNAIGCENKPENLTLLLLHLPVKEYQVHRRVRHALEKILDETEFIVSMDEDRIVILLSLQNEKSALRILEYVARRISAVYAVMMELNIHGFSIGISDTIWKGDHISRAYDQADLAQAQCFYDGYDKAFFYCNLRQLSGNLDLENKVQELADILHEGQIQKAREQFGMIMDGFRQQRSGKEKLRKDFFTLIHIFYRVSISEKIDLEELLGVQMISEKWCESFHTLKSMEDTVNAALDVIEKKYRQRAKNQRVNSRQVQAIMNYIEKNYMKELSLEILSEEFGLTPNYLCKIFKSSTGIKLTQYINQVRIAGACKLMKQTNLRSHEIAEMVGFSSPSYY